MSASEIATVTSAASPADDLTASSDAGDLSRPSLNVGVRLEGPMPATSFQDPQFLVQNNGTFVQVSELLYRVLEQIDGTRTLEEVARAVTEATEWMVEPAVLRHLIASKLVPLGLVALDGAPAPAVSIGSRPSPLNVGMRMKMLSPRLIHPAAEALQFLFRPWAMLPAMIAAVLAHAWMYKVHGATAAAYSVLYSPGALVAVFVIVIVAAFVHELGHAAALRYGGGRARGIGAGLYLIFPAFYTDVTDTYRLGRNARIRTDLGGIYFHAIVATLLIACSAVTGSQIALFSALLINIDILRQFIPFVRLDGYWLLADITGVPDFFSQMGPFLRSTLRVPGWSGTRLPPLRPAARYTFAIYTLMVVPVLTAMVVWSVARLPWFVGVTRDALSYQLQFLTGSYSFTTALLALGQMLLLAIPLLGTFLILFTVGRPVFAVARAFTPPAVRQFAAGAAVAALLFTAYSWYSSRARDIEGSRISAWAAPWNSPDAATAVVTRARKVIAAISSVDAKVSGALGDDRFAADMSLQRPNLARLDINGTAGLGQFSVVASDGSAAVYFPADNQFSRFAAGPDGRNLTGFFVAHVQHFFQPKTLAQPTSGGRLSYVRVESVEGDRTDVVDVLPGTPEGRTARYFVSQHDGIVRRIEWRRGEGNASSWVQLTDVALNTHVDPARFAWTMPRNAKPLELPLSLRLPGTEAGSAGAR